MHELAITESVVSGVCERVNGSKVVRVVLQIGKLSGIVPDAIRFCFDVCASGTNLEGATLEIFEPSGRAKCRDCRADVQIEEILALCECGSANLEILSGQELLVKEVEVV